MALFLKEFYYAYMKKFEEQPGENNRESAPEAGSESAEKRPSLREVGRERIKKIGSFFSRVKEGFENKTRQAGEAVSSAVNGAKKIGIAGFETGMATPEAVGRGGKAVGRGAKLGAEFGFELGIGAGEMTAEMTQWAGV